MDNKKTGELIRKLRTDKGLTQKELADKLHISDKTISKWERGHGCPDISILPLLSRELDVNMEILLSGELDPNDIQGGNMKNTTFYYCETCGNVITAADDAAISCCGKNLNPLQPQKAKNDDKLQVEIIDNEYYISGSHEMTKDNYVTFICLLTGDTMYLKKLYPEWDIQVRIPKIGHGKLLWYSLKEGLMYQLL